MAWWACSAQIRERAGTALPASLFVGGCSAPRPWEDAEMLLWHCKARRDAVTGFVLIALR